MSLLLPAKPLKKIEKNLKAHLQIQNDSEYQKCKYSENFKRFLDEFLSQTKRILGPQIFRVADP